jgi:hypothetical protein
MIYAKVKVRKVWDPTEAGTYHAPTKKRYSFEHKEIVAGGEVHWPALTFDRFDTRKDALKAAEQRGWKVVKTWDEAIADAGLYSHDGYYHSATNCPCPSQWCLNHTA